MVIHRHEVYALLAVMEDRDIDLLEVEVSNNNDLIAKTDESGDNISAQAENLCYYVPTPHGTWKSACGHDGVKLDKSGKCLHCGKVYKEVRP